MIEVEVADARTVSGLVIHKEYIVRGKDRLGEYSRGRRFKEFESLQRILVEWWPGVFIPSVPDKRIQTDNLTVGKRLSYFNQFITAIASEPLLYYCQIMQIFLRAEEEDISALLDALPKQHYSKHIARYSQVFKTACQQELGQKQMQELQSFRKFLSDSAQLLNKKKQEAKGVAVARDLLNVQQSKLFRQFFVQYQRLYFKEGEIVQSFGDFSHKFSDNPYWVYYVLFKSEYKDAVQAIKALDFANYLKSKVEKYGGIIKKHQQQIAALQKGELSLKSAFSRSTKEEQLQSLNQAIDFQQKKISEKVQLREIVLRVQYYFMVPFYKRRAIMRCSRANGALAVDRWPEWASFWEYLQLKLQS